MAQGCRILIVLHTAQWIEMDQWLYDLSEAGYRCEAVTKLEDRHAGDYDLVILCGVSPDLERAKMAVLAMRQLYASAPLLVLTGHKDAVNIGQFLMERTHVLSKPFGSPTLIARVGEVLQLEHAEAAP